MSELNLIEIIHLFESLRIIELSRKKYLYNFDPLTPHFFYSKTGVYRGIYIFSYFCSKR